MTIDGLAVPPLSGGRATLGYLLSPPTPRRRDGSRRSTSSGGRCAAAAEPGRRLSAPATPSWAKRRACPRVALSLPPRRLRRLGPRPRRRLRATGAPLNAVAARRRRGNMPSPTASTFSAADAGAARCRSPTATSRRTSRRRRSNSPRSVFAPPTGSDCARNRSAARRRSPTMSRGRLGARAGAAAALSRAAF